MPKSVHGIDFRGSLGGDPASNEPNQEKKDNCPAKREWVGRLHAVKAAAN
jgi:hypothetical protein